MALADISLTPPLIIEVLLESPLMEDFPFLDFDLRSFDLDFFDLTDPFPLDFDLLLFLEPSIDIINGQLETYWRHFFHWVTLNPS